MEISKIRMRQGEHAIIPDTCDGDTSSFRMYVGIETIHEPQEMNIGGPGITQYTSLIQGSVKSCHEDGKINLMQPMDLDICPEDEHTCIKGDGRLLCLKMAGGTRGYIHPVDIAKDASKVIRIGEAVGKSMTLFYSETSGLEVTAGENSAHCGPGEALAVKCEQREFGDIRLSAVTPEKIHPVVLRINGILLQGNDFAKLVGVRVSDLGNGYCKAELDVRKEHKNPIGTVHGGCLFTLADAACGLAASSVGGICTTINSTINFLNPVFNAERLTAEAQALKIGRKIRIFEVKITDEKGTLVCNVQFTFYSLQN